MQDFVFFFRHHHCAIAVIAGFYLRGDSLSILPREFFRSRCFFSPSFIRPPGQPLNNFHISSRHTCSQSISKQLQRVLVLQNNMKKTASNVVFEKCKQTCEQAKMCIIICYIHSKNLNDKIQNIRTIGTRIYMYTHETLISLYCFFKKFCEFMIRLGQIGKL